jgi:hypothetical protein
MFFMCFTATLFLDLPADILYAFADIDPSNGTIKLTDPYADEQARI